MKELIIAKTIKSKYIIIINAATTPIIAPKTAKRVVKNIFSMKDSDEKSFNQKSDSATTNPANMNYPAASNGVSCFAE